MRNDKEFIVQRIRSQYVEREMTELDELRALDREVKRPAQLFAYIFGSISAVIMGAGMSLIMTDIGSMIGIEKTMLVGLPVGITGLAMALVNYPIFNKILESRKKKYAGKIIELSDRIV